MILQLEGVFSGYRPEHDVLRNLTLAVPRGGVVSIIGPNGAGKSTIFKTIFGFLRAKAGRILFDGQDITNRSPREVLLRGIGYVPQGALVFGNMTVQENLEMGGYVLAGKAAQTAVRQVYEVFPILGNLRRRLAKTLSGGERQLLAMARGVLTRPKLMCLDEPSLGLAPRLVQQTFEYIKDIRRMGVTVLIIEQNARSALVASDYAYVLDIGTVRFEGSGVEILANPDVRRLYLGETMPAAR